MTTPRPTCPTGRDEVGQRFRPGFIGRSDLSDLSDQNSEGGDKNDVSLSALAARWRTEIDHDAAEAEAMREHYAAAPTPYAPTDPDPLRDGLLRGVHEYRLRLTATRAGTVTPR
ncbi:hypothetical protein [Roseomonas chloroacetimidivorans]|uniref:hypothetical protein n=1 Tax=Roseomonas chloroacetimidivorans TaxID=1766656 RepID=UPI003C746131